MSSKAATKMAENQVEQSRPLPKLRFSEFIEADGWDEFKGCDVFEQISNKQHNADLPVLAITQEHGAIPRELIDYHVSVAEKSLEGYKVVEDGDFIISLRSFQGGIEYSKYRGICSPAYVILRAKRKETVPYFRHFFKTDRFIKQLNINLEGIRDGKMVSYSQFSELLLPTPPPAEQQKIAECLSSIDELIAAEGRKLDALKTHKKGLMQQLFPAEGETIPRLRIPEFRDASEWQTSTIGQTFETDSGGTPTRSENDYWNGDIPWITTSLVHFNHICVADECISQEGLRNSSAKVFPKDTVLIAMYGQGKTRGQVAMLDIEAATNQACSAILPREGIDPEFVSLNLVGRYEELRGLSNPGGQENLSQTLIKKLPFSFPSDTAEQQRITDCLAQLDQAINKQILKNNTLISLKKGLMQQLFPSLDEVSS